MAISVGDSFSRSTAQPRFADEVVADIATRDAIPVPIRYVGMKVVVNDDGYGNQKTFILNGGTADVNWVEDSGGGSGSGAASGLNLLEDPSFEKDTTSEWTTSAGTLEIDGDDVLVTPYNVKSMKVTNSGTAELKCVKNLSAEYAYQIGKFSGRFKAPVGEVLEIFGQGDYYSITATGEWQYFNLNFLILSNNNNEVGIRTSGSIVYYVDELFFGVEPDYTNLTLKDTGTLANLPLAARHPMMIVRLLDEEKTYQLVGGFNNINWTLFGITQPRLNQNLTVNSDGQQIDAATLFKPGDYVIDTYVDGALGHSLDGTNPFLNDYLAIRNRITIVNISPNPLYIPGRNADNPGCSIYSEPITLGEFQSATYEYMGNEGISTNPIYALISKSN